jgi:hypothetical protein
MENLEVDKDTIIETSDEDKKKKHKKEKKSKIILI